VIKQILLPLIGVAVFIAAIGFLIQKSPQLFPGSDTPVQRSLSIGSKIISFEVAKTDAERAKGLSGRSSLPEDGGMLFVFDPQNVTPGFWMKETLIPLDIIWINDGHVVKIDKNIEPPKENTPDSKLKVYKPDTPIDYVLEVNAGYSDKNGVEVTDSVVLPTL